MARPREFDTDSALADAMNVFWEHGYDAASVRQLLAGMGLTRGSLYKAFIDKKSLFLRVLNRYEVEAVQSAVALLTTGPADGIERINTLFASVIETAQGGDRRGCLLCSAAAGPAAVDEDIAEIVHGQLGNMQQAFYDALAQSQAWATVGHEERSEVAYLLMSQYVGVRVLVRSNAPIWKVQRCVSALQRFIC